MIKEIWNWIFGSKQEIYLPGQRVRLVCGYPSDMADEAKRRYMYGTVQPKTDDDYRNKAYEDCYLVKFDGYPGIRYMNETELSPNIYIETDKVL